MKKFITVLLILLLATNAQAQVAVGTTYLSASATSDPLPATVTLESGEVGVAGVCWRANLDQTIATDPGATFNGSATGVTRVINSAGVSQRIGLALWYITGVTGTGVTFQADFSAATGGGSLFFTRLTGVDTGSIVVSSDIDVDLGGETGTLTNNLTDMGTGDLLATMLCTNNNTTASMAASGTPTATMQTPTQIPAAGTEASTMVIARTGTGTVASTITWTGSAGPYARMGSIAFNAGSAPPAASQKLMTLGAGEKQ